MTPTEKANNLVEDFGLYTNSGLPDDDYSEQEKTEMYFAKQAAMLCVDEIIKANPVEAIKEPYPFPLRGFKVVYQPSEEYWQQVKQEIEKI
ncbi:hypothetical protein [Chitinophaga nivalis]|uniref:Phage protein n=1 Tax=Chitinophaga nivalis TaxID=2991709 RepID=A0ABT3IIH6_9BACT|nr:hypothetical protein [Chitinophaga nivalis]MCW3466546.1 hypothetical protein [Chitinophaga nivalis]MCW3483763.1 hypothetical protein [Chitinophaga nivalis]